MYGRLDKYSRFARRHKSVSRGSILFPADSSPLFHPVVGNLWLISTGARGQQPTFQAVSYRYFRYYPRIVANWHVNYHASSRKFASPLSFQRRYVFPSMSNTNNPPASFAADLGLNFEQITRSYFTPGNPEFHARDERSFVIFSVHVHNRTPIFRGAFHTASIELHFGAKRRLPLNPVTVWKYDLRAVVCRGFIFACLVVSKNKA